MSEEYPMREAVEGEDPGLDPAEVPDPFDEVDLPEGVTNSLLRFHVIRGEVVVGSGAYYWDGTVVYKQTGSAAKQYNDRGVQVIEGDDALEVLRHRLPWTPKNELVWEDNPTGPDTL